jgi:hypothetical protein
MDIFGFFATPLHFAYGQLPAGRIACPASLRPSSLVKQLRPRKFLGHLFNLYQFPINNKAK